MATDYWRERARKYGHTGWADQAVYAYDRLERLASVRAAILSLPALPNRMALDFGCGTGDFSNLLLGLGYAVCGYDPFVRPAIRSPKFRYASNYSEISTHREMDLVLSITVLDHILGEDAIREALRAIAASLKPRGTFYMLEYALDSADDRKTFGLGNDYQAFRTLHEWESLLTDSELRIVDVSPAPHPHNNPSEGYLTYARSPLVRMRRFFPNLPMARAWCDPMLQRRAARIVKNLSRGARGPSILKMIRCSLSANNEPLGIPLP